MRHRSFFLICCIVLLTVNQALQGQTMLSFEEPVKQRLFVLTDITNEPDDQQSMVRLLVYANEYDIEGIVATTSTHLRNGIRKDKIEELVRNYGKVKSNLDKHASGFPTMEYLLGVTTQHLPLYSMDGVGEGKDCALQGAQVLPFCRRVSDDGYGQGAEVPDARDQCRRAVCQMTFYVPKVNALLKIRTSCAVARRSGFTRERAGPAGQSLPAVHRRSRHRIRG